MRTCKDCIHDGVCWKQKELLDEREFEEEQECCEEASRFIEVPCKVGDTVWFIRNIGDKSREKITETSIEKIVMKKTGLYIKLDCNAVYETSCNSIGKTVFLTKEEAEKALKERSEGK